MLIRSSNARQLLPGSVAAALVAGLAAVAMPARAGDAVNVLIVMENGSGSAAQAQPYVDKLMEAARQANGWSAVEGKYATKRDQAREYLRNRSPKFGIFSLGAFLGMRKEGGLDVIGVADVDAAGGRRYHLISKDATDLSGCKGKKLASNHVGDAKFIERVVADGAFSLSGFEVVSTPRPVQTLKSVIKGEAACALVDNAQLAELAKIEGGSSVKTVWSSSELPPMAVVAFSGASSAERAKFKSSLGALCSGQGKSACDKVGIKSIRPADDGIFGAAARKYGN